MGGVAVPRLGIGRRGAKGPQTGRCDAEVERFAEWGKTHKGFSNMGESMGHQTPALVTWGKDDAGMG